MCDKCISVVEMGENLEQIKVGGELSLMKGTQYSVW